MMLVTSCNSTRVVFTPNTGLINKSKLFEDSYLYEYTVGLGKMHA